MASQCIVLQDAACDGVADKTQRYKGNDCMQYIRMRLHHVYLMIRLHGFSAGLNECLDTALESFIAKSHAKLWLQAGPSDLAGVLGDQGSDVNKAAVISDACKDTSGHS